MRYPKKLGAGTVKVPREDVGRDDRSVHGVRAEVRVLLLAMIINRLLKYKSIQIHLITVGHQE